MSAVIPCDMARRRRGKQSLFSFVYSVYSGHRDLYLDDGCLISMLVNLFSLSPAAKQMVRYMNVLLRSDKTQPSPSSTGVMARSDVTLQYCENSFVTACILLGGTGTVARRSSSNL